ncbi:MAG: phosphatase PAP2 family protein [Sandaracinaceae bacterium]|nr:phosphatase PAP2 family protein [Sandaracinaceae bacterium]
MRPLALALGLGLLAASAHAQEAQPPATTEAATETPAAEPPPAPRATGEDVVQTLGEAVPGLRDTLGLTPTPSHARVQWDPSWPRYTFDELVLTLGFGLVWILAEVLPTRADANWSSGNFFDDGPQQIMGLSSIGDRSGAAIASDVLVATLVTWPLLFDSLLTAGVGENAWDVAWQLALINLEALAINQAITAVIKLLARRERPFSRYCREEPGYASDPACTVPSDAASDSFYSAHTSAAFTSASLICLQHDALDLFGATWADVTLCASALAAAGATGLMRIVSDNNYLSDVLIGMGAGLVSGLLLPWLLHFRGGARPEPRGAPSLPPVAVLPMLGEDALGLIGFGVF